MWAPGGPPGPGGWDRRRVGARLLAALAGLQELQGLRARQQARVRGALAMQPPPAPAAPRGPRAHELRLEAALAALQEQLNQLRCQDVGLKTHLDQLDQQISELQLGVHRTSTEGQDNDSRPSSGFYELSDGGSCSLSTSRTSMCSDHLSSSLGTLLPATPMARTSTGDCRPWSADETTMCGPPLPTWGLQATVDGTDQTLQSTSRPRPVSTGDLGRALPAPGRPTARTDSTPVPLLCPGTGLRPPLLDPKYQSDLVSKGGREVYPYPSPLHAVALQSPLFALTEEPPSAPAPRGESLPGPSGPGSVRSGPTLEAGPPRAYIDRLLRLRGQGNPPRGSMGEQGPPGCEGAPPQRGEAESHAEGLACPPRRANPGGGAQRRDPGGNSPGQWGPAALLSPPPPGSLAAEGQKPPSRCICVGAILGSPWQVFGPRAQQSAADSGKDKARPPARTGPGPCDRPPSVARGTAPVGVRTGQKGGHPGTKAAQTRRETSDTALRSGRPPPPRGTLIAPHLPPAWGAGHGRRPPQAREPPSRSCSESSLYPVSFLVPLLVAPREGRGASAQALLPVGAAPAGAACGEPRRRQCRSQSSLELSARGRLAGAPGPGLGPPRPATRRGGGPRPACPRARARLSRLDPQPRSESGGSEHSAECASLFHSTIAETSEDEASDHTANRFGDRESSGSDEEGSVQGSGSHPAWPGVAPQPSPWAPPGSRPPLTPVPRLCRVRASRALKKKIRRFQPAALKVMTLV